MLAASVMIAVSTTALAKQPETFKVTGPTIIAFFPRVSQAEINREGGVIEASDDFQFYLSTVKQPLKAAQISLRESYSHAFQVFVDGRLSTFKVGKEGVGYYLVAPGKRPRIEKGVMTDVDLLEIASKYFGKPIR